MNPTSNRGTLPVMRAHYADILCQLAAEKGARPNELLAAADIRSNQLSHPENLITADQFAALCRKALDCCGDNGLVGGFGLLQYIITQVAISQADISCDTLEKALQLLIKYLHIRYAYVPLDLFTEDDEAVIQLEVLHDSHELYRFHIEVV